MQWKIVVRIYANLDGLQKTYARAGLSKEEHALPHFAAGFTQSQPLFDVVDVGHGKERANHKTEEQLNLFVNIAQCKHIVLGMAHDNGYVSNLDPLKNDPDRWTRMSLIQPVRPGREYRNLPFDVIHCQNVFRREDLTADASSQLYTISGQNNLKLGQPASSLERLDPTPVAKGCVVWRHPIYPGPVLLNKDDQRVDELLGTPTKKAESNLKSILEISKLCNDHQLRRDCDKLICPYAHEPLLEGEELIAFALKARKTPCRFGSKCRSAKCMLGHQCPNGSSCRGGRYCYFRKVHHVDPQVSPLLSL
ncbi:MAG: hypothetical protein Q9220_000397 [cf. Caloplaca sp. 1 TL-2023]